MEGIIKAICISEQKGTEKHPVQDIEIIEDHGLEKDAHAGKWHRQVSLLSYEKREEFKVKGANVEDGAFGENLLVSGIEFTSYPVGTQFKMGDVLLELTQIGKSCHSHCAIYHQVGQCIMPHQGVFTRVIHGGHICVGDTVEVIENKDSRMRVAVLTLSDKASIGQRKDESGPLIEKIMTEHGYNVTSVTVIADDENEIVSQLINLSDRCQNDLILTTGGTGLSVRDVTPEATMKVMTRNVPGISEALRYESMKYTNKAMLSRGASVLRNQTLIINLPGSPKAVKESLDIILGPLKHGLEIMKGEASECARK